MSPITHFIGSWLVAAATTNNVRDRRLVTLAGILPDLDGVGMAVDLAKAVSAGTEPTFYYYQRYHHFLLHGWPAALAVSGFLALFAQQRLRAAALCLITFHLHLLCDLLGSRGPSPADLWPIAYGEPLFRHPFWYWRGQWRLDGWQNGLISLAVLAAALAIAIRTGHSFVEVFSRRLDAIVVAVLQKWSRRFSHSR